MNWIEFLYSAQEQVENKDILNHVVVLPNMIGPTGGICTKALSLKAFSNLNYEQLPSVNI